jgi:hypothetical protein
MTPSGRSGTGGEDMRADACASEGAPRRDWRLWEKPSARKCRVYYDKREHYVFRSTPCRWPDCDCPRQAITGKDV